MTTRFPPIAGPFPAIPAKPYLNSCCQSKDVIYIFKYYYDINN